jgi:hypothetical protein
MLVNPDADWRLTLERTSFVRIYPFVWEKRALWACFGAGLIALLIGAVRPVGVKNMGWLKVRRYKRDQYGNCHHLVAIIADKMVLDTMLP